MPKASDHQGASIKKTLYLGDSGTGKTTSLLALVKAGYTLRIFDFDNLLDPLITSCRRECPEHLDSIEFMSFRDKMKMTEFGPIVDGTPKAFTNFLKTLFKWEDDSNPAEWGPKHVAIVDSLTTMSRAAYFWARGLQGASGLPEGMSAKGVDGRAIFFTAQQAIMNCLAHLTGADFNTNLIVIAHLKYLEHDGVTKGFPLSTGAAISPEIPTYFPLVSLATKKGETRIIRTRSTNMIDLKDPKAFDPAYVSELPMATGLAEIFK
jgi:hypothetical protein